MARLARKSTEDARRRAEAALRAPSSGPDDAELVRRARAGDRWAFEAIFRRHVDDVLGLATRLLGRTGEADDVVQDTFAAALTKLDRLDDPAQLRPWLRGIAVHRVRRRLRARRWLSLFGLGGGAGGGGEGDGLFELASSDASPEVRGELVLIDGILARLPAEERIAWSLRRIEGEPLEEIARITGASLATVKRRIHAVEIRMRATIDRGAIDRGGPAPSRDDRGASA
jgi:RNA polymerase sigma-70 factor (ECF subfamily)